MNTFKKNAIMKEFPFIKDALEQEGTTIEDVDKITIHRADREWLNSIPVDTAWDGSAGNDYEYHTLFAYTGTEEVSVPLECRYLRGSNYAYSQTKEKDGDTILSALKKHNVTDAKCFVMFHRKYSNWSGSKFVDIYNVKIYKCPRGYTIEDVCKEAEDMERISLSRELDKIDDDHVRVLTHMWMKTKTIEQIKIKHPQAKNFRFEAGIAGGGGGGYHPYFTCHFDDGNEVLLAIWSEGKLCTEYCGTK